MPCGGPSDQSRERPLDPGAGERPRSLRPRPDHRLVAPCRAASGIRGPGHGEGAGEDPGAGIDPGGEPRRAQRAEPMVAVARSPRRRRWRQVASETLPTPPGVAAASPAPAAVPPSRPAPSRAVVAEAPPISDKVDDRAGAADPDLYSGRRLRERRSRLAYEGTARPARPGDGERRQGQRQCRSSIACVSVRSRRSSRPMRCSTGQRDRTEARIVVDLISRHFRRNSPLCFAAPSRYGALSGEFA